MQRATSPYPGTIETVEQLEDLLSEPTPGAIETFRRLEGDLVLLGVGLWKQSRTEQAEALTRALGDARRIHQIAHQKDGRSLAAHGILVGMLGNRQAGRLAGARLAEFAGARHDILNETVHREVAAAITEFVLPGSDE